MTNPQYETLILEEQGAVDWLTLNRRDSLNALNPTMAAELILTGKFIDAERSRELGLVSQVVEDRQAPPLFQLGEMGLPLHSAV